MAIKTQESDKFYQTNPDMLAQRREQSKHKSRLWRSPEYLYHCPARAFVETGNEEAPVEYFCKLARLHDEQRERLKENKGFLEPATEVAVKKNRL